MTRASKLLLVIIIMFVGALCKAEQINVSDPDIEKFLEFPFQYDFTRIKDDSTFREFIDQLDYQLAKIEYRQRLELALTSANINLKERYSDLLGARYNELLADGYMFSVLAKWRDATQDHIGRVFADILLAEQKERFVEPGELYEMQRLLERIANRLYSFQFKLGENYYSAPDAARLVEETGDINLAHDLFKQQNDSAAVVADQASQYYYLYRRLGERFGYKTSFDYNLSFLAYEKSDWVKVAQDLRKVTEGEFNACLDLLRTATGRQHLKLFEVELILRDSAVLADSLFPAEKCLEVMDSLVSAMGLKGLMQRIKRQTVETIVPSVLAIKLQPPYDNVLYENHQGGFDYFRQLARETGRIMMWAYSDSTLPYMLRDYPQGCEEMLTGLIEDMALDSAFLAEHFSPDAKELDRFVKYNRWFQIFHIRQVLLYFLFDYYLSDNRYDSPAELYWSLESSLLDCPDSSYLWIETLLMGTLSRYPERLAHIFGRIKLKEILHKKFGISWKTNKESGKFIIDEVCRPGRAQTIKELFTEHAEHSLSLNDIKRQYRFR